MRDENLYRKLFADTTHLEVYRVCADLYFVVDAYFKKHKSVDSIYQNNLRYHLMMLLAWRLNGSRPVHPAALRYLKVSLLKDSDLKAELDHAIKLFDKAGAEDRIAKDAAFTDNLKKNSLLKVSSAAAGSKPKHKPKNSSP